MPLQKIVTTILRDGSTIVDKFTREVYLYKFDELDSEGKAKALESFYDINVDYEWWDYIYDDAKEIGLVIDGFDISRNNISGSLTLSLKSSCEAIISEHGPSSETYKTASSFLKKFLENEDNEDFDYIEEKGLEDEYKRAILEDYLILLRKEYEYQTSEQTIVESIRAGDYLFQEDGTLEE
jgi:hypothetical protein